MDSKKIELQLLDNGLHFLIVGLDWKPIFLPGDNNLSWKYSILNTYAGIELILKEKLKQEHWSLIFENLEKANEQKLQSGDFLSVNYKNCLIRLSNICQVQLLKRDEDNIDELRKIRNRIQHYEFSLEVGEVRKIIGKSLCSILNFIDSSFKETELTKNQKNTISILKSRAYNFKEFIEYKKENIKNQLNAAKKHGRITPCPNCRESTVVSFKGKISECLICEFKTKDYKTAKSDYLNSLVNRAMTILKKEEPCPDCDNTLIKSFDPMKMPPEIRVFCFRCGDKGNIPIEKKNKEVEKGSSPI